MTTSTTCRHGLLTYERDGQTFHRYDGARCEPAPTPTPSRVPEPLAYQRVGERNDGPRAHAPEPVTAPAPMPSFAPAPARPNTASDLFKPAHVVPTEPAPRRARPWRAVAAAFTAVLLLAGGVVIGFALRRGTVDRQHRRVTAAEDQIATLHGRVSRNQATIDEQQRQLAAAQEQQARLKRRNEQLVEQAAQPQPTGANATSFTDGLYQAGVAIQAGRYHTDGGDNCYWATLSTGDTTSVIESNLGAGPQTVTIDSPYFESEGCGTWTKVA